jgi:hypothetical protein
LIAAVVLAAGGYFTWRNLRVAHEGQITNRYTQAIGQLGAELKDGAPNLEVRLGAIYVLERIAKDSPRDYATIFDVLTAYVRQNAPWIEPPREKSLPSPHETMIDFGPPQPAPALRTDIAAIVAVISRWNLPPPGIRPLGSSIEPGERRTVWSGLVLDWAPRTRALVRLTTGLVNAYSRRPDRFHAASIPSPLPTSIPQSKQPSVFDRFTQLKASHERIQSRCRRGRNRSAVSATGAYSACRADRACSSKRSAVMSCCRSPRSGLSRRRSLSARQYC